MLFIVSHNLCNHTPLRDSQRQGIRDPWPSPCGSAFSSWSQQKYCLVHPFPTTQAYHCFWQMLVLFGDRIFPVYGSIKCFSKATFLENKVRFIQMNIEHNEMETELSPVVDDKILVSANRTRTPSCDLRDSFWIWADAGLSRLQWFPAALYAMKTINIDFGCL